MKKYAFILLLWAIGQSCGVNNLAKYNLHSTSMYFDETVSPRAQQVILSFDETNIRNRNSAKESTLEAIGRVATSVAGGLLASEVQEKLQRVGRGESLVQAISTGFENTLVKYYNVRSENDVRGEYAFVAETILEESRIFSSPQGIFVSLQATCIITDRASGATVWENSETERVPLRQSSEDFRRTSGGSASMTATERDISNALQVADLASLTEEQLRGAIMAAAEGVGAKMAQTLRKDITSANSKRK